MPRPKISVLMPVLNAGKFFREALDSVLAQTYTDWELLVADDGSTDGSPDVLRSYDDPRIRTVPNPGHLGYLRSINRLFGMATGEFITFQDADDFCHPERFRRQVEALENDPDLGLCGTFIDVVDSRGKRLIEDSRPDDWESVKRVLLERNPFCGQTIMIRREIQDAVGGYRECFEGYSFQDYDWAARAAQRYKAINIPEVLYSYRQHPGSISKGVNVGRAVGFLLARALARQRAERGSDFVMEGNERGFAELKRALSMPFENDRSFLYRDAAVRFFWGGLKARAIRCAVTATWLGPWQVANYRTLVYILRHRAT